MYGLLNCLYISLQGLAFDFCYVIINLEIDEIKDTVMFLEERQ